MSILVVAGVAATLAGVFWVERWQVRRAALRRGVRRRSAHPWLDWATLPVPADGASRELSVTIERAVVAGDVAWSYRELYERTRANGESPFQFRRGRMEDSAQRYDRALDRVRSAAEQWVHDGEPLARDPTRRHAVQRLLERLETHTGPRKPDNLGAIEALVELMEATLARVRRPPSSTVPVDPFRW